MPKPRGDFQCIGCGELYELPLGAAACPDTACGGLLERRFTPPMVNTAHARQVDRIAEPVLAGAPSGQRPPGPAIPQAQQTRSLAPAAALGMVGGESRAFSRGVVTPALGFMRGKGPRPIPYSG